MAGCSGKPDEAQCQFECEMTIGNGNAAFIDLLQCMAEHGCLPDLPEDGACLARESRRSCQGKPREYDLSR